ncbi:regenerating islet-derived protein 3-alpha-like [Dendropsophus ebraccatus]|uniref:regenerating islet-derived protein 3-alpha-like n=1 Tax=Dendropsophus ebraccatus TaxID=150705 RepID=UPI0038318D0E
MLSLLLLLLVGTTFAQESGDFAPENSDQLTKVVNDEKFHESFDDFYAEEKSDEEDQESDHIEPDFTIKAVDDVCPNRGTCHYHAFLSPKAFFNAQNACRRAGGNLSSIHNRATNAFLTTFMKKAANSNFVWIGVWKPSSSSTYWNLDESPLNYTNWQYGKRKTSGQWCTAMNIRTGRWWSVNCNARLPFLCTYEE